MKDTFKKDLDACVVGKVTITANALGRVNMVRCGHTTRVADDAVQYVEAHPNLAEAFAKWRDWRRCVISEWKHETPRFRYTADRGAIALRIGRARVLVGNGEGDGVFPVYVDKPNLPPTFKFSGTSIDGPCKVDVLDYDGDGANVLQTIRLTAKQSLMVYVEEGFTGAVALAVCGK